MFRGARCDRLDDDLVADAWLSAPADANEGEQRVLDLGPFEVPVGK